MYTSLDNNPHCGAIVSLKIRGCACVRPKYTYKSRRLHDSIVQNLVNTTLVENVVVIESYVQQDFVFKAAKNLFVQRCGLKCVYDITA